MYTPKENIQEMIMIGRVLDIKVFILFLHLLPVCLFLLISHAFKLKKKLFKHYKTIYN